MQNAHRPSLGILNLERGLPPGVEPPPPRPNSILSPTTYDFPVILETVKGAWAETVIRGESALETACVSAAKRLVARGAVVITSNCGFFMRHQQAVAASVDVPVVLSSLLLLPTLLRQLPSSSKVALLTADSTKLDEELLGVGNPAARDRIVVGGVEGGEMLQNELKRPPVITAISSIQSDVERCLAQLRAQHPEIAAILFECTAFPLVASEIRRFTHLPVYDITTLCRMTLASVR